MFFSSFLLDYNVILICKAEVQAFEGFIIITAKLLDAMCMPKRTWKKLIFSIPIVEVGYSLLSLAMVML